MAWRCRSVHVPFVETLDGVLRNEQRAGVSKYPC